MLVPAEKRIWLLVALVFVLCRWSVLGQAAEEAAGCAPVARIVSIQGTLQLQRAGQSGASYMRTLGTFLCQNDLLHTDAGSRAALFISPETLVRLDQNSTVRISQTEYETVVEFIQGTGPISQALLAPDQCGAGYFITRYPRRFRVITPFTHAAVEGTEFLVAMRCEATEIAVFEGRVRAEQTVAATEAISLTSGQSVSVGKDQAPAIRVLVKPADAVQWVLYYPPLSEPRPDVDQKCESSSETEKSRCLTSRAERRLRAGRVDEAQSDINEALTLRRDNADADALYSVISVVKNDKIRALELAQRATQLDPLNPRAWIALSYAQQANFKLEDALGSSERAAELTPRSSIAQARVAELLMSLGKIRSAERAALAAVNANPDESRARTILGFVHLAQIDAKKARADFEAAIDRDSSDPLPRLGLGLAVIRAGNLKAGREEIEIAVVLDPTNSLIRSYVGKAYYEENTKERDQLAAAQFGLSKQLDTKDPTPWFYDAILKQTQNRPVDALEDLQKSIELNNQRSIYRSRLLIDQDFAARSADLARTYQDLGLEQSAVGEAALSLAADPTNSSAHRFLADLYASLPRHEVARQSELLQAMLTQSSNVSPISPLSARGSLIQFFPNTGLLRDIGPARAGLYEFTPLFIANGANLYLDTLAGDRSTWGDQAVLTAVQNNLSVNIAQGHLETGGFGENGNLKQDVYEGFVQLGLSEAFNIQFELLNTDSERGENIFAFDPAMKIPVGLEEVSRISRIGLKLTPRPDSTIIASGIYQAGHISGQIPPGNGFTTTFRTEASTGELQYLFRAKQIALTLGGGHLTSVIQGPGTDASNSYDNAYIYGFVSTPAWHVNVELGLSLDRVDSAPFQRDLTNPKLGVLWEPYPNTLIRAAAFRTVARQIIANQTIEPTQVAGFNQFFDDPNASISWRYGLAVDQRINRTWYVGVEGAQREITAPVGNGDTFIDTSRRERTVNVYLHHTWRAGSSATVFRGWSGVISAEYHSEYLDRTASNTGNEGILTMRTQAIPVGFTLFPNDRFSIRVTSTAAKQRGELQASPTAELFHVDEHFSLLDILLKYYFPARKGVAAIGIQNVFNRNLGFFQQTDPATPRYAQGRFVYGRVTLSF